MFGLTNIYQNYYLNFKDNYIFKGELAGEKFLVHDIAQMHKLFEFKNRRIIDIADIGITYTKFKRVIFLMKTADGYRFEEEMDVTCGSSAYGKAEKSYEKKFSNFEQHMTESGFKVVYDEDYKIYHISTDHTNLFLGIRHGCIKFLCFFLDNHNLNLRKLQSNLLFNNTYLKKIENGKIELSNEIVSFSISDMDSYRPLIELIALQEVNNPKFSAKFFDPEYWSLDYDYSCHQGIKLGAYNEISELEKLDSIGGIEISEIEVQMRGHFSSYFQNRPRYLRDGESLKELLIKDNISITNLGITHQEIAEVLFKFSFLWKLFAGDTKDKKLQLTFNGKEFNVLGIAWSGVDPGLPFPGHPRPKDGFNSSVDITIERLENGEIISIDGKLPYLIFFYGFYPNMIRFATPSYTRIGPEELYNFFYR